MGSLIEQPIPTLFQGVSRQPDVVRLPGQVEVGDNATMSVITGGFEKRAGSVHRGVLSAVTDENVAVYAYDRDAAERYIIIIEDGDLHVYDLDGNVKTVDFPDGKTYLTAADPKNEFAFVTIADYTFIANKDVTVLMGAVGGGAITGTVQTFANLPGSPSGGQIYKVVGKDTDKFTGYYVEWNASGAVWEESAKPNLANTFDATTMPHQLVRDGDGTFTFQKAVWEPRAVGDDVIVPDPDFVGSKIRDLVFFRDRLTVVADETMYCSQAGDYFNFWPDKAIDVLDSDPLGRTASTSRVNLLNAAVPFRRSLFATSDKEQFEVSADGNFTPRTAVIDPVTAYAASAMSRPLPLGDTLYFAADADQDALLYEYFFEADTISNTASNVTKHVEGYVPSPIVSLTGDTTTGTVVALADPLRNALFLYRVYWDGEDKVMSSWSRWVFGATTTAANILGIVFVAGRVYIVVSRNSQIVLESVILTDEFTDDAATLSITNLDGVTWPVRLDRRVSLTGTYDAGTNLTTWTTPYTHNDDAAVVSAIGQRLVVSYPTSTTITAVGDFSATAAIIGLPYEMRAQLSRQYVREDEGRALTGGRLQLRTMSFNYQNTGYFEVHVTPKARTARVFKFSGRTLGDAANIVGQASIASLGTYRVPIKSRGDTVKIELVNGSHLPCAFTSASWVGFYNEITRQE